MPKRRYRISRKVNGRRVYTVLYRRWKDMRSRAQGCSTRRPDSYRGIEIGWPTFAAFRKWALANGFSKATSSPDRQDSTLGYVPGNVQFETIAYNRARALENANSDYAIRGEEPPAYACDY